VTLPFLSLPNALPPKCEYAASIDPRAFFASLGVVYQCVDTRQSHGYEGLGALSDGFDVPL